jgi:broad specificity phosphatase PhoE
MSANSSTSGNSPVTGIIEESEVIIDFGKYEGKSVEEIAELDPNFYDRLATEKESGVFAIRRHKDKTFRLYINPLSNIDH